MRRASAPPFRVRRVVSKLIVLDEMPEHVNAAVQRRDPESMLNWTERIIRMRKEVPEIGWGDFTFLPTRDPAVLVMRYDWRNNSVLFVHNLSASPREVKFATGLPGKEADLLVNLLTEDHSHADSQGSHCLMLEAYAWRAVSRRRPLRSRRRSAR